jgi:iron complex outermembrane receptor protein
MVVTGSQTAGLLSPAATSAVAFDSDDLDAFGVEDVSDIAAFVPNLEISSQNATNASFFVRGVGLQDFGANASSAVPIIQDGIVRNPSAAQLTGLYDIGGLTVLRGPQGVGNYRNASAGAIVIESAKPTPEFSGYAQATLAQITSVDAIDAPRYDFETAVSAPIFEDIISLRLSARYSHEKAFVENNCANRSPLGPGRPVAQYRGDPAARLCATLFGTDRFGNPVALDGEAIQIGQPSRVQPFIKRKIGEVDDYGFRAQLRFNPPDSGLDITLRGEASNLNRDSTVGAHIGTGRYLGGVDAAGYRDPEIIAREQAYVAAGLPIREAEALISQEIRTNRGDTKPFRGSFDNPGRTQVETFAISQNTILELDVLDLEFNAGYVDVRKSEFRDTDLSPNIRFPSRGNDQAWEFYGDFMLTQEDALDLPLVWRAGGWSILENVESSQLQTLFETQNRTTDFEQEIYGFGLFFDAEYQILESITLAGGIRYNWERKNFTVSEERVTGAPPLQSFQTIASDNQRSWDAPTGFLEIRYAFTEDLSAYMKYSRGFKAGHFNPSRPDAAKDPGVGFADPEKIDSMEWGFELAAWDNRLSANGAFFFYNYRNYQVFRLTSTFGGVFREIQNADRARNMGAEIGLTIRPLEGFVPPSVERLQIKFEGGWLDTEFVDFVNFDQLILGNGSQLSVTNDNSGNPLISAPQLQAALSVSWPIASERLGTWTPQYDLSWTDDVPFDANRGRGQRDVEGVSRYAPYEIGNRAYALHNVRLTYEPPGSSGIRVSGWCRNLTDQRYDNFSVDLTNFALVQLRFPSDPRTCGADLRLSW